MRKSKERATGHTAATTTTMYSRWIRSNCGIPTPFAAEIRDGVIYARGVADNKDGLATRLCAIDAWMKTYGKLLQCEADF